MNDYIMDIRVNELTHLMQPERKNTARRRFGRKEQRERKKKGRAKIPEECNYCSDRSKTHKGFNRTPFN